MKIAISVQGNDLSAAVDPRFGRAQGFLIVDEDTLETEHIDNPNIDASGGAGIQSAQLVVDQGVSAVITGNVGPNAFKVFNAAGVSVFTGASGTARSALESYSKGDLSVASSPTVSDKFGMGRGGRGGGNGHGFGRK